MTGRSSFAVMAPSSASVMVALNPIQMMCTAALKSCEALMSRAVRAESEMKQHINLFDNQVTSAGIAFQEQVKRFGEALCAREVKKLCDDFVLSGTFIA
jgi:hypothetical protein